jgi:superfamily I DNA and RNA helicase
VIWLLGNIKLVAAGAAIIAIALFAWHYNATIAENVRLNLQLEEANSAIALLDAKAKNEAVITQNTNVLISEVRNAPKTDDAAVAIVLKRAIASLRQIER